MSRMRMLVWGMMVVWFLPLHAQENENSIYEQQLEQHAAQEEIETEDDSYWQYLEWRGRHRLNLNKADAEDLRELNLLTDLQIDYFLQYRRLFGSLVSIYELQAVPGWDLLTIRKLLPFVSVRDEMAVRGSWFLDGEHRLLFRFSQVLEKAKGFLPGDSGRYYAGSPLKILTRYRYQYRDQLQYGLTGDKDAGEQFFKGEQSAGFDFYSFHFFLRRVGIVKALAIGDFIVNLGQGLVHWQGQAFKKSAAVMNIKRQGAVLKPYTSAGEYNFLRGAGITIQQKIMQATVFASSRKWTAAVKLDEEGRNYVTSVQSSGYHRTKTEQANKNTVNVLAAGGNLQWRYRSVHIGVNGVCHFFSVPFRPSGDAYDYYAIDGGRWFNGSIDYSYTVANIHGYGEVAIDKNFNTAMVHGWLLSAGGSADIAIIYRRISPAYQAVAGNAFSENSMPTNESGFYTGLAFRAGYHWRMEAYADFFRFPWLKYRVDAPSQGYDYMLQLTYTPNKRTEVYGRWRMEEKAMNYPSNNGRVVEPALRKSWRGQVTFQPTKEVKLINRVEILWYTMKRVGVKKNGFLIFQDIQYNRMNSPWKLALRLQYFETDDYDTRLYAFEYSVMYNLSMPAFFNKGIRWYATVQYKTKINKRLSCIVGFNISRSEYSDGRKVGSGYDELPGNHKTETKLQAIFSL